MSAFSWPISSSSAHPSPVPTSPASNVSEDYMDIEPSVVDPEVSHYQNLSQRSYQPLSDSFTIEELSDTDPDTFALLPVVLPSGLEEADSPVSIPTIPNDSKLVYDEEAEPEVSDMEPTDLDTDTDAAISYQLRRLHCRAKQSARASTPNRPQQHHQTEVSAASTRRKRTHSQSSDDLIDGQYNDRRLRRRLCALGRKPVPEQKRERNALIDDSNMSDDYSSGAGMGQGPPAAGTVSPWPTY